MDRTFTPKEARQLISDYERLAAQQNGAFSQFAATEKNITQIFGNFVKQGIFQRAVSDDLINGGNTRNRNNPALDRLISSVYSYRMQEPVIAQIRQLNAAYKDFIDDRVSEIRPAANGVRWLLTSGKKKEAAARAFYELQEVVRGVYSQETDRLLGELRYISGASQDEIRADFGSSKFSYWKTIHSIIPDAGTRGGAIREFAELEKAAGGIFSVSETAKKEQERNKEAVESAAQKMLASSVLTALKGVPVEELTRDKKGIRVKALRDAGYESMADIYTANAFELSSINGISEDTAYDIRRIAQEFAYKSQGTMKIRLSADSLSPEATELVSALHQYRTGRDITDQIAEIDRRNRPQIAKDIQNLESMGNGSGWFFYSDDKADALRRAYADVCSFITGADAARIRELDSQISRKASPAIREDHWNDFQKEPIQYINALEEVCPGLLGNDDSVYGLPEDLAREIQDEAFFPDGLTCELRRYQEWGVKYILHQGRVLLGDEMGLGKTVQAIAAMVSLKNTGATHFLVVCPASVIENWCREIRKHSKLRVTRIHGQGKAGALKSWLNGGGAAVTTYETTGAIKLDDNRKIDLIVVDEAHYVKNPEAQRSKNVAELCTHAERMLFMTGTALENRVDEMISLIKILNPQIAGRIQNIAFLSSAPQFREAVAPVYYRRKREDVLTELPELIENEEWCSLTGEETAAYEAAVLSRNYAESRRVSWNIPDAARSSKANRMRELIEEAASEGRKILVFSFFLDTIRKVCGLLGTACYGPINGSVPPTRRQQIIDEFNEAPAGSVLAAQIQAGGTGLNIQAASVVIICEPQLKPSIENQAISRSYRMGQARNVLVYRLLADGTIDERVTEILTEKQEIFDAFADKSVAGEESLELDEKTFGDIISEEIDRINRKRQGRLPEIGGED